MLYCNHPFTQFVVYGYNPPRALIKMELKEHYKTTCGVIDFSVHFHALYEQLFARMHADVTPSA